MKQIILGTAGHIDHGKTSLIRTITGINTDRLKEEQARGITIELGFAHIDLSGGERLGIVDVPGHEKFVKHMVAGASGIDIVAMVIAADEGIMPQTREHMEICSLLGIRHGFVVMTKMDLVDEEWQELVTEDIREFVRGTFLEDRPMVHFSAATGQGKDDFMKVLEKMCAEIPAQTASGLFRLPVDRVFSMKGFGTVITGTLISGQIRVGDTIMIYPSGVTSKVRGIQVHNETRETAESGMRTAINFQGLEKTSVNRGDVLSTPKDLVPSYMLDATFSYLQVNKKPLKNRTRVRFHSGTSEIMGNIILLEHEELPPGETGIVQIRLDTPVTLVRDDRFVVRSYSPVRTIGGGQILNPIPGKHKRFREEIIQGLKGLAEKPMEDILSFHVGQAGYEGLTFTELKLVANMGEKKLDQHLQKLSSGRTLILLDKENRRYVHADTMEKIKAEMEEYLRSYHRLNPLKAGMYKEELKSKFPPVVRGKLWFQCMEQMVREEKIRTEGDLVLLPDHKVSLATDQADLRRAILEIYKAGGLSPPYFKEVCKSFDLTSAQAKDVLMVLIDELHLIKVKEDLYFDADSISALKNKVAAFFAENEEMSPPQFKDIAGVSRKYLIPLLEYFDSKNITIRVGDVRRFRGK